MNSKYIYYCMVCVLFTECRFATNKPNYAYNGHKEDTLIKDNIKENRISKCLPKDTINQNFSVRYIDKEEYYTIELKIKDSKKVLDCYFKCSDAQVFVPEFLCYYDNYMCLQSSCGDHCVNYYIFKLENKSIIQYCSFENAYDIDLVHSRCVIIDQNNFSDLLVIDFAKQKYFKKSLKTGYISNDILNLKLNSNFISLTYQDSTKQSLFFSNSDFISPISKYNISAPSLCPTGAR